jgi:hypothetical protein
MVQAIRDQWMIVAAIVVVAALGMWLLADWWARRRQGR